MDQNLSKFISNLRAKTPIYEAIDKIPEICAIDNIKGI